MAVTVKTTIANLALSNVERAAVIEDLDNDTTTEAKTCRLWYDHARREALQDFDWTFARMRQALALHATDTSADPTGTEEWTYRYEYPGTCIQPRKIWNPVSSADDAVPYAVELASDGTQSIVTDMEEAILVFTKDQETVSTFSPYFVTTLGVLLGHYIAHPLTGSSTKRAALRQDYIAKILIAGAHDANAERQKAPRDADWIRER